MSGPAMVYDFSYGVVLPDPVAGDRIVRAGALPPVQLPLVANALPGTTVSVGMVMVMLTGAGVAGGAAGWAVGPGRRAMRC